MTTVVFVVKLRNKSVGEEENSKENAACKLEKQSHYYQVQRLTKGTWQAPHGRAVGWDRCKCLCTLTPPLESASQ